MKFRKTRPCFQLLIVIVVIAKSESGGLWLISSKIVRLTQHNRHILNYCSCRF